MSGKLIQCFRCCNMIRAAACIMPVLVWKNAIVCSIRFFIIKENEDIKEVKKESENIPLKEGIGLSG